MSVPPYSSLLANGSMPPWWVCPPDRELALRAKIRTGYSTVGGRVRNENKTFLNREPLKSLEAQARTPRSFHSSFKMSPSLYRRLTSIQTQKNNLANTCKHCTCGGMVSDSGLTDEEIETIKKVVSRAETVDKVDDIRVGCLFLQFKELQSKCAGNGTTNCILCNVDLTVGKHPVIETCSYCEKAVCTKCRVQVDAKHASGHPVVRCKVCSEEQELWCKSGAWMTNSLPKVTIPEYELRMYKEQIEQSKMPVLNRGYSLTEAPVGESVRSPSICSDVTEGSELDITNALRKFNFPKQDSTNSDDLETRSSTKSPLELFSPSPTLSLTHTLFDEVEETSQAGLEDLLRSHSTLDRRAGSPHLGERFSRLDKSSMKRSGAVRKSRKSKQELSQTLPANSKDKPNIMYKRAQSHKEPSEPSSWQVTPISRSPKRTLSGSHERIHKPRARTPDRDGELSHSSEDVESSSESELGEPLVIASTPSDAASSIIGIVPDIIVQEAAVEGEDTLKRNEDVGKGVIQGDQHDRMTPESDQDQEQEGRYCRPRSYAVLTRPGASPVLERKKMYPSSDEEERASSREERKRANSGGIMKEPYSSGEESSYQRKSQTLGGQADRLKRSTPHLGHHPVSLPISKVAKAVDEGSSLNEPSAIQATTSPSLPREEVSPVCDNTRSFAEQSILPEIFPHAAMSPEDVSSLDPGIRLPPEDTPLSKKSIDSDLGVYIKPVSTPTEQKKEFLPDSTTPHHTVPASVNTAKEVEGSVTNDKGKSKPFHDSISDLPVTKEVESVKEVVSRPRVEKVSQPEVENLGQDKNDTPGDSSEPSPRSRSLANGKEEYRFRRRGATRLTHKHGESNPSGEDASAMTVKEKARMAASRVHSDGKHISSSRERHQSDFGADPSEEMVPSSGSSDLLRIEDENDEGVRQHYNPQRRRDIVRNVRHVQRRDAARLNSSRRRQYEERHYDDYN